MWVLDHRDTAWPGRLWPKHWAGIKMCPLFPQFVISYRGLYLAELSCSPLAKLFLIAEYSDCLTLNYHILCLHHETALMRTVEQFTSILVNHCFFYTNSFLHFHCSPNLDQNVKAVGARHTSMTFWSYITCLCPASTQKHFCQLVGCSKKIFVT